MNNPLLRLLLARLNESQSHLNRLALYASGQTLGINGSFWKGRKGKGGDLADVVSALVQNDQISPCIERIVGAQLDRDPEWQAMDGAVSLLATTDELPDDPGANVQPSEIVDVMTDWHDEAALLDETRKAAASYQWAGRMVGRVYIPDDYQDVIDARSEWTLADALELVHVQAVDPRDGGPLIDGHGRVQGYFFAYSVVDLVRRTTLRYVQLHTPAEVQLYQRVGNSALIPVDDPIPSPVADASIVGSRRHEYLMFHADRLGGTAITPSITDSQDRLNVSETYFARNDDMTGFRMIVAANAEDPVDLDGKPTRWKSGPDVVISLLGIPKDDRVNAENGGRETPTMLIVDPLDPTSYSIPSVNHWERNVRGGFDQAWTLDQEKAVSGESQRVTRKPFDKRVIFASPASAAFMAWALRAAVRLAASIVGKEAQNETQDIRFKPRMYLEVDSKNLEEFTVKLAAYEKGALDLESVLEATPGITDVSSVKARVQAEKDAKAGADAPAQ
ncbi:hypothetical protein ACI3L1_06665 [Deinococcus sp. SM5_A1]|uniref:hypothetical protein n=1 Tax=Deinococcus sp. SM5_A1 TaxID=3379094 RepID=UPI00385DD491